MRLVFPVLTAVLFANAISVAHAQAVEAQLLEPRRGELSYELIGAGSVAAAGVLAAHFALRMPPPNCQSHSTHIPTFDHCSFRRATPLLLGVTVLQGVTPVLTASAVMLAGSLSDGEGRFGATLTGTYALGGLVSLVSMLATQRNGAEGLDQFDNRVVMPLTAAGMAAGAVLGYRLSARSRKQLVWSPSVARDGWALSVSGII